MKDLEISLDFKPLDMQSQASDSELQDDADHSIGHADHSIDHADHSINHADHSIDQTVINPEECNLIDDDLDGLIDEGQSCSDLLVNHCEMYLGIADFNQITQPVSIWRRDQNSGQICSTTDDPRYNCASTGKDQKFHPITIYGVLDDNDWLGLGFKCQVRENLSMAQKQVLQWVNQHCAVYLGYENNTGDTSGNWSISTNDCTQRSPNQGEIIPRCVKSQLSEDQNVIFSVLQLGTEKFPIIDQNQPNSMMFDDVGVNGNDAFGIAFGCHSADANLNQSISKSVEVFFGMNFPQNFEGDNGSKVCDVNGMLTGKALQDHFNDCPDRLSARSDHLGAFNQNYFCIGSSGNEQWTSINVRNAQNKNGNNCDEFVIALVKSRIRN
jgi:hypothetical protein